MCVAACALALAQTGVRASLYAADALVQLPAQLLLGWYGHRLQGSDEAVLPPPPDLRAGDLWQLAARLKAPHGHINPHGFDYELWLWEQSLQATGYVRNGAKDAQPQWLGHPRADVLERYVDLGVQVVQTPRCGASQWVSTQPNLVQCERNQRQRYWQHVF